MIPSPGPLDRTLAALADPTRRAILERLGTGEARITAIAEPFAISLNSVSKHIKLLERAGLVRRHKKGREHFVRLSPAPITEAERWILAQRTIWMRQLRAPGTRTAPRS